MVIRRKSKLVIAGLAAALMLLLAGLLAGGAGAQIPTPFTVPAGCDSTSSFLRTCWDAVEAGDKVVFTDLEVHHGTSIRAAEMRMAHGWRVTINVDVPEKYHNPHDPQTNEDDYWDWYHSGGFVDLECELVNVRKYGYGPEPGGSQNIDFGNCVER